MDWFVLIVIVPLIVAPIVLLCGYAGCAAIAGLESPVQSPPPAPSLLSAQALNTTGVRLTWSPDTSAVFFVERALMTGVFAPVPLGPSGAWGVSGATVIDSVLTGLTEGTSYRYQLKRAHGASGQSLPSGIRRVTTFPNPPENLQTTFAGPGRAGLRWLNRTTANPVEFEIERQSPADTGTFVNVGTVVDASEFQDVDPAELALKSGTKHRYRVIAVIPSGFANDVSSRVKSEPSDEHEVIIV